MLEEAVRSLGHDVTGSCEPLCVCGDSNQGPPKEQLLTTEPALQPKLIFKGKSNSNRCPLGKQNISTCAVIFFVHFIFIYVENGRA